VAWALPAIVLGQAWTQRAICPGRGSSGLAGKNRCGRPSDGLAFKFSRLGRPRWPTGGVVLTRNRTALCFAGLGAVVAVLSLAVPVGSAANAVPPASKAAVAVSLSISVQGNHFVNGSGQTVRLLGVNRSGSEYMCVGGGGQVFDGPYDDASIAAISGWHTNAVRVPLNEDCWLGINGLPSGYSAAAYQQQIVTFVNLLNAHGQYAILDLHWSAPGSTPATGQQDMADADHSPAFWTSVANTFKGNQAVVFDLYNEPHDISWDCWKNGGCADPGYVVAGMQSLLNAVRATGASQPIMAGGLGYAGDISQWLSFKPRDPGNALVASFHTYNFSGCDTTCWNATVKPVAGANPVVTGELGEDDCAHGYIDAFMDWADQNGVSYLAWAWDPYDCGGFPSLIIDYSGTPTTFGVGFKDHLAGLGPPPTPSPSPSPAPSPSPSPSPTPPPSPLSASISAGPQAGDAPLAVAFSGTAVGGVAPYSFVWTFGDGSGATSANPSHTYTAAGTYSVGLTVSDAAAQSATASAITITVSPSLRVGDSASVTTGIAPLAVSFTSTPTGGLPPYGFVWTFGDGGSATSQNPSHTYSAAGGYSVNLTVTDANGATSGAMAILISVDGFLSVSATAAPDIGDAPLTTTLSGSVSGGTAPYTYLWDLGDGTTSTSSSPNHVYGLAGSYTATLTVNDGRGQVSQASAHVTVYPALSVSLSATPASGVAPLQVTFTASATGGLAPYSLVWSFGDGAGGSGTSAVHSYASGTFYPTLTVTDAAGGAWTGSTGPISVTSPPTVSPSPTPGGGNLAPRAYGIDQGSVRSPAGSNNIAIVLRVLGLLVGAGLGGALCVGWIRRRFV
jgi:PKD repeat protein